MRRTASTKAKKDFQTPQVVFQPRAVEGMQAGFNQLVELIRPTLGPLPHIVACEKIAGRNKTPELLDSGGAIARRVIQIADRQEDVGLMFLRHALWQQQEREGDGTATAAVLFQEVYRGGRRYITAGGNAMLLRKYLEQGLRVILTEIDRQVTPLSGKQNLAGLARSICYDDELASRLGEIFDIIGAFGRLEVRKGSGRELIREYIEGMYWEGGLRSRVMANAEYGMRANLENAAILISDLNIESPEQIIPLLELALERGVRQVLLVSSTLSERAMSLLFAPPNRARVLVAAVKIPGNTFEAQQAAMEDLAILTGGRAFLKATGDSLETVQYEDLGRARRIWAENDNFGMVGGQGDARKLRQHIASLRQAFSRVKDAEERKRLQERIGKLLGGSATLYVGGYTPTAIQDRLELAKRTAEAMRGAMREGVVPGGGAAFLSCREALQVRRRNAQEEDERVAYSILLQALKAPFQAITNNAGVWSGSLLAEVERRGSGYGVDVLTQQVVDMRAAGLLDAASVVKGAAQTAISSAALALTTETIVHHRNPEEVLST